MISGHRREEESMAQGDTDEVEEVAPRVRPYVRHPGPAQFNLLSSLLHCQTIPRPIPILYLPDMSVDAETRRKNKATHIKREKRRQERWQKQQDGATSLKTVAIKKAKVTVEGALLADFKPFPLTGWSGPRVFAPEYNVKVMSTPDALSFVGLALIGWDGK